MTLAGSHKMSATPIQKQKSKELIEATWAVVARVGVDNATVREIAREAGCTTGALWHHFRNRDDLIDQAIDQLAADFFHEAEREWEDGTPGRGETPGAGATACSERAPHQRDRALVLFRLWSRASDHEPTALVRCAHTTAGFSISW